MPVVSGPNQVGTPPSGQPLFVQYDAGPFLNTGVSAGIRGFFGQGNNQLGWFSAAASEAGTSWPITEWLNSPLYHYHDIPNNRVLSLVIPGATGSVVITDLQAQTTSTIDASYLGSFDYYPNGGGMVCALPNGDITAVVFKTVGGQLQMNLYRYHSGSWSGPVVLTDLGDPQYMRFQDIIADSSDVTYISYTYFNGTAYEIRMQTVDSAGNLGPVCTVMTGAGPDWPGRRMALFGSQLWVTTANANGSVISVYRSGPLSAVIYPSSSPVTFTQSYSTSAAATDVYGGAQLTGDATSTLWLIFNDQTLSSGITTSDRMIAVQYSGSGDTWGMQQQGLDWVSYQSVLVAAGMLSYPNGQTSHFWSTHQYPDGTFGTLLDFNSASFCYAWYTQWELSGTPPSLTCGTIGSGQVGVLYSAALAASGGASPYTFSVISGGLPPGLFLNASTGQITGTPTASGLYPFEAQVIDSLSNSATVNCSISVIPAPPPLQISCGTCGGAGCVGQAYSCQLSASGGVPPYTFAITGGSLPPGLTINTSTGVVSGTPTQDGTANFTVTVTDSRGATASASCAITVDLCGCTDPLGGVGLETVEPSILPTG